MFWIVYGIMVLVTYVVLVIHIQDKFCIPPGADFFIIAGMAGLWPFFWIGLMVGNVRNMFHGGEG